MIIFEYVFLILIPCNTINSFPDAYWVYKLFAKINLQQLMTHPLNISATEIYII